jgi:hypothetical protein
LAGVSCRETLWTLCLCVLKKRLETQRHREHGEGKKEVEGEIGRGKI